MLALFFLPVNQPISQIKAIAIRPTGNKKMNALKKTNNKLKIINAINTSNTIPQKLIFSPIPDSLD